MVLTVAVLAGISLEYDMPNKENEVILLVDTSDSSDAEAKQRRDDFVRSVINYCDSNFKYKVCTEL